MQLQCVDFQLLSVSHNSGSSSRSGHDSHCLATGFTRHHNLLCPQRAVQCQETRPGPFLLTTAHVNVNNLQICFLAVLNEAGGGKLVSATSWVLAT